MIDWPNLIAGFVLGLLASLGFVLWDRAHERAKVKEEVRANWISAANELRILIWKPDTTSASLYVATANLPLDRWRRILGPDDFRALERVQGALGNAEGMAQLATDKVGMKRLKLALEELQEARAEFHNVVVHARGEDYTQLIEREQRQKVRRDFLHHPVRTWKRERHRRRVRQTDTNNTAVGYQTGSNSSS